MSVVLTVFVWVTLGLALLPLGMILRNLGLLRPAPPRPTDDASRSSADSIAISVLIPARDEAAGIEAAVRAALAASDGVAAEVVVLDDHSTDDTAAIVRRLADVDPRVRLESAPPLPAGWNGKQHACWVLANRARGVSLLWVDADVRLAPGSVGRMSRLFETSDAKLFSGVPRQFTGGLLEVLIVPQILLVLLGYLPIAVMRRMTLPGLGAGCGQLFLAERSAYFDAGGHEAIRGSIHDGVDLPRTFRRAGHLTDLFDATDACNCRMYTTAAATWHGFSKNAVAGMADPKAIGLWTVLLLGGHVLPYVAVLVTAGRSTPAWVAAGAALLSSVLIAARFRQGVAAALLRPVGVLVLVALQWTALARHLAGHRPTWRGRTVQ